MRPLDTGSILPNQTLPAPAHSRHWGSTLGAEAIGKLAHELFAALHHRRDEQAVEPLLALVEDYGAVSRDFSAAGGAGVGFSARQAEYDRFFRVARASDDAIDCLAMANLAAVTHWHLNLLRGSSLSTVERVYIKSAAVSLLHQLARLAEDNATPSKAVQRPGDVPQKVSQGPGVVAEGDVQNRRQGALPDGEPAFQRWIVGHQLFFVLIQGIVIALEGLEEALGVGETSAIGRAFEETVDLLWASAIALRFAGDFSGTEYDQVVRPIMEPPHVSEGFSGEHFVDHARLLRQLRRIKKPLLALPDALKPLHQRLLLATDAVYANHAFVCSRFVQGASLLDKGKPGAATESAPAKLWFQRRPRTLTLMGDRLKGWL